MAPLRFVMLGGFLGAGKTTAIARLARMYQERGQTVAIVTNGNEGDLIPTYDEALFIPPPEPTPEPTRSQATGTDTPMPRI